MKVLGAITTPVAVLGELAAMALHHGEKWEAIHDAVAELIEAAQEVLDGTVNALPYPDGPCIDRRDRERLIAAVDRCGGAQ